MSPRLCLHSIWHYAFVITLRQGRGRGSASAKCRDQPNEGVTIWEKSVWLSSATCFCPARAAVRSQRGRRNRQHGYQIKRFGHICARRTFFLRRIRAVIKLYAADKRVRLAVGEEATTNHRVMRLPFLTIRLSYSCLKQRDLRGPIPHNPHTSPNHLLASSACRKGMVFYSKPRQCSSLPLPLLPYQLSRSTSRLFNAREGRSCETLQLLTSPGDQAKHTCRVMSHRVGRMLPMGLSLISYFLSLSRSLALSLSLSRYDQSALCVA